MANPRLTNDDRAVLRSFLTQRINELRTDFSPSSLEDAERQISEIHQLEAILPKLNDVITKPRKSTKKEAVKKAA